MTRLALTIVGSTAAWLAVIGFCIVAGSVVTW